MYCVDTLLITVYRPRNKPECQHLCTTLCPTLLLETLVTTPCAKKLRKKLLVENLVLKSVNAAYEKVGEIGPWISNSVFLSMI